NVFFQAFNQIVSQPPRCRPFDLAVGKIWREEMPYLFGRRIGGVKLPLDHEGMLHQIVNRPPCQLRLLRFVSSAHGLSSSLSSRRAVQFTRTDSELRLYSSGQSAATSPITL